MDMNEHLLEDLREPTALSKSSMPHPFTKHDPMTYNPAYTTTDKDDWTICHRAQLSECDSPWNSTNSPGDLRTFLGKPRGFPDPVFGDAMTMGWEKYTCFERQGRLGPYGYSDITADHRDGDSEVKGINWDVINWGEVQNACYERNKERFETHDHGWGERGRPQQALGWLSTWDKAHFYENAEGKKDDAVAKRTAILVRARYDTKWHASDMQNMRALIKELTLHTGGEYQVFLLVEAREDDVSRRTWLNEELYKAVVAKSVPPEFAPITYIYTGSLLQTWYPAIPPSNTLRGASSDETFSQLALQRFAHTHPTFSYYLPLNLNTRFTGHWYTLLSSLRPFATRQPRKLSWEKAERLYIPSLHGPYDTAFRDKVSNQQKYPDSVVWEHGREVPEFKQHGPNHGSELAVDEHYMWGVGEEADLISLSPIFNPNHTAWEGRGDIWGYKWGKNLKRRAILGEEMLMSKLLLDAMHAESVEGRFLGAKMAAPTIALLHGLKVVAAPMPVWMEGAWKPEEVAEAFSTGPLGQLGDSAKSSYGKDGSKEFWWEASYDPESTVADELWDRWMGRASFTIEVSCILLFLIRRQMLTRNRRKKGDVCVSRQCLLAQYEEKAKTPIGHESYESRWFGNTAIEDIRDHDLGNIEDGWIKGKYIPGMALGSDGTRLLANSMINTALIALLGCSFYKTS